MNRWDGTDQGWEDLQGQRAVIGSARRAALWGNKGGNDEADHGLANRMFQEDHAAKLKAQGRGNGRTHISLGTNTINQTDHLAQKFQQKAQPVANALHKASPTKANFTHGQPSSWNLNETTAVTFTADRPHGIPVGHRESFKGGEVESINNTQVKAYIRVGE